MRIIVVAMLLLTLGWGVDAQEDEVTIRQIVLSADATPDTGYLAVAMGLQAYLYDLHDLDAPPKTFALGNDYGGIALNHDGSFLMVPGDCNQLILLETSIGEQVAELTVDRPYCNPLQLTFSHDGNVFFTSYGTVYYTRDLLDNNGNSEGEALPPATGEDPIAAVFSADDSLLALTYSSGTIDIYDMQSRERITVIEATPFMHSNYSSYHALNFSGDGLLLAALLVNGPTNVFEVATGDLLNSYWQDTEATSIAVWIDDANGRIRSVHRGYRGVTYWRVYDDLDQTLNDVAPIELETLNPAIGTFSTDGSLLVIVTDDNTIALHDGTDGALLNTLSLP